MPQQQDSRGGARDRSQGAQSERGGARPGLLQCASLGGEDRGGWRPALRGLGERRRLEKPLYLRHEFRGGNAAGQAGPLVAHELLRHQGRRFRRFVDDDRHDECGARDHVMGPLDPELPLPPEVAFPAHLRGGGDQRHEKGAFADLLPYLLVPGVAPAQLALVKPGLDAKGPQRVCDAPRRFGILPRVAKKDRPRACRWNSIWHGRHGFMPAAPRPFQSKREG